MVLQSSVDDRIEAKAEYNAIQCLSVIMFQNVIWKRIENYA